MKIVIHPDYKALTSFLLTIPDRFDQEGVTIYQGRNVLKVFDAGSTRLIIKRFQKPHLINRMAYTYFRQSKACRSYLHAQELLKRGVHSPAPIAYMEETSGGLLLDSYYVSVFEADSSTIRDQSGGQVEGQEAFLFHFTRFVVHLHKAGILHKDFSPGNVLYKRDAKGAYVFSLIDINRLVFRTVSPRKACMNLQRLCTSREVLSYIARVYARECGWDEQATDGRMTAFSDAFFVHFMYHQAAKAWRRSGKPLWKSPGGRFCWCYGLSQCRLLPASVRRRMLARAGDIYAAYLADWDFRQVFKDKFLPGELLPVRF